MKSALTLWANLEAARDDSSMNLNYGELYASKLITIDKVLFPGEAWTKFRDLESYALASK